MFLDGTLTVSRVLQKEGVRVWLDSVDSGIFACHRGRWIHGLLSNCGIIKINFSPLTDGTGPHMTPSPLTELRDRAPHYTQSIDRVTGQGATWHPVHWQSYVTGPHMTPSPLAELRDRAPHDTQSIDRATGQGPAWHPPLVHVTKHIKITIATLQVPQYSYRHSY
jgi:hypothetical protein